MTFVNVKPGDSVTLATPPGLPELVHVFEKEAIEAINAALAAGRPLLLRGEPGVGKSQLARAAAKTLERAYIQHVVDSQAESRDLLWHFDAVERLGEAQVCGALGGTSARVRTRLAVDNFLRPGPLWWAFNWTSALKQAERLRMAPPHQRDGGDRTHGCVVLVDEIDKADADMPNGLLEALGAGEFTPFGRSEPIVASAPFPLVVITSNEERALPDAFIRRCVVLHLTLPAEEEDLVALLEGRGRAHFPTASPVVLTLAAQQLVADRTAAMEAHRLPLPGQAEYLDLVRAVVTLLPGDATAQEQAIRDIAPYIFQKHRGAL